jgi:hypothetical protein
MRSNATAADDRRCSVSQYRSDQHQRQQNTASAAHSVSINQGHAGEGQSPARPKHSNDFFNVEAELLQSCLVIGLKATS